MNEEFQDLLNDLLAFANSHKYVITQVNIDFNQTLMEAVLHHYKTGEKFVLYYNGCNWEIY